MSKTIYLVNSDRHIGRHGTIEPLDQKLHTGFCRMHFIGDGGGLDIVRMDRLSTAAQPTDEHLVRRRYADTLGGKGGSTRAAAKAASLLARELVCKGGPLVPDPARADSPWSRRDRSMSG
jgi:hypothetical protein